MSDETGVGRGMPRAPDNAGRADAESAVGWPQAAMAATLNGPRPWRRKGLPNCHLRTFSSRRLRIRPAPGNKWVEGRSNGLACGCLFR